MATLINGAGFYPVTAQEDADLYAGIFGNGPVVLDIGNKMTTTLVNSNRTVRVRDGVYISQGRRIQIDVGLYDDFAIPTSPASAYYIIGYQFTTDSDGNETVSRFTTQVPNATSTIPETQIRPGANSCYFSLYRVQVANNIVAGVTALFSNITDLAAMYDMLNNQYVISGIVNSQYSLGSVAAGASASATVDVSADVSDCDTWYAIHRYTSFSACTNFNDKTGPKTIDITTFNISGTQHNVTCYYKLIKLKKVTA